MAHIYGIHAVLALLKNSPKKAEQIYLLDNHANKTNPVYREILDLIQENHLACTIKNKKRIG
jgi:tRNA G18 (ribose-2'-O)-methylase SpoU